MLRLACAVALAIATASPVAAPSAAAPEDRPAAGMNREQNAPGAAGPKDSGVVQRGDTPSAAAGELMTRPARRVLGLPVDAALIIVGVLVVLALFAGVVIPGARRRDRARGGGTYGGAGRRG